MADFLIEGSKVKMIQIGLQLSVCCGVRDLSIEEGLEIIREKVKPKNEADYD